MPGHIKGEKVFRGIAVSAGVCRGKVVVLHHARHAIVKRELPSEEVSEEVKRFEHALVRTRQQITEVQRRVADTMSSSEADIFDAHLLMLEDRVLIEEVIKIIREQRSNADYAFHTASGRYISVLEAVEDQYLRERAADLRDLATRVLDNLLNVKQLVDLRLLMHDGRQVFGADVYRYVTKRIWWTYPVYLFSVAPIFRRVFDFGYRTFARNRFHFSRACGLQGRPVA